MRLAELKTLDRDERMQLMKFVCSFAWADLDVGPQEREFVARMIVRLKLDEDEAAQCARWLEVPPGPEEVDPTRIPRAHRALFVAAATEMATADGRTDAAERESLELLQMLTGS